MLGLSKADKVLQNPFLSVQYGEKVTLNCTYETIDSNPYLHWYIQRPEERPHFILHRHQFIKVEDEPGGKYSAKLNKESKSTELRISGVSESDSGLYYCALSPGMMFGLGTTLNVMPNIKDTEPSVYRLKADKNVEGVPKSVCLATDFPVLKNETELKLNTEKVNKDERLWLDKTEDNTWRYSTVILNSDCRVEYDDKTILEKPSAGKIECSSPKIDETFKTDERLNTLSLRMLGLRFLTIKAIVFNIIITLRLWSS
ncbi:T cell receptor alpha constant [Xenopus tropicalis]|uniref:T cell receptor alpha constant n=1 Tax=Xenopus tropicalis TaxID=8364 RepID=UPI0000419F9B|nr:T cell receptor alpha constant [Xenopus tropicalis]AAH80131.1 T cell receptor alpha constant [Xenopus tropicalis]|eukprot:NP_001007867.1 T cell receptor alpha constant [Xenopus tropicalis]